MGLSSRTLPTAGVLALSLAILLLLYQEVDALPRGPLLLPSSSGVTPSQNPFSSSGSGQKFVAYPQPISSSGSSQSGGQLFGGSSGGSSSSSGPAVFTDATSLGSYTVGGTAITMGAGGNTNGNSGNSGNLGIFGLRPLVSPIPLLSPFSPIGIGGAGIGGKIGAGGFSGFYGGY
jgi:hypothetical protein